jgi:hypothetical protein
MSYVGITAKNVMKCGFQVVNLQNVSNGLPLTYLLQHFPNFFRLIIVSIIIKLLT